MSTQKILLSAIAVASASMAWAQEESTEPMDESNIEEVVIIGQQKTYGNNAVTESMLDQQSSLTSVLDVIDNIPGVLVNEGDNFGADDWSTTVSMRGFQLNLDAQQIGMTIDGIPNGNSNYGGGSKANRFIDPEDLAGVEVSQGTADISSRSHEALGGTLNFLTSDPTPEAGFTLSTAFGEYDAQKIYLRADTGEFAPNTSAWISYSKSESTDFMEESAENEREHVSAKLVSAQEFVTITGFYSYDDTQEDNYQRITRAEFDENDEWDRLTGDWTGIPYVDQVYRRGWSTLRENTLAYLKLDFENDGLQANGTVYYHANNGRGDWLPPYVVDPSSGDLVTFVDNSGTPISYIGGDGTVVVSIPDCESTLTFPYGGGASVFDPTCQDASNGAIPVGSYRHTHYSKTRLGFSGDFAWTANIGEATNTLRGGIWLEDYMREESRNWHEITDSRVSFAFDGAPYWLQYKNEFPVTTTMYYLEDSVEFAGFTVRLGGKKFFVELDKDNQLTGAGGPEVNSDSDLLPSIGVVYNTPVEGLEVFAGYSENFAAIKDVVLESAQAVENIEPETAKNTDFGLRYQNAKLQLSAVYYDIEFENRIVYFGSTGSISGGADYLSELEGTYINAGGIEANGFEFAATYNFNENFSLYSSYTFNDATYLGTGDSNIDSVIGVIPGNTVIGSPENMLVVSLDWTQGLYRAGLSQKWVDERYITIDNSDDNIAPDYSLFDMYVGAEIPLHNRVVDSLDVNLTVNNLLDEHYLAGISGNWGAWVGAPRTAVLGLTAKF